MKLNEIKWNKINMLMKQLKKFQTHSSNVNEIHTSMKLAFI